MDEADFVAALKSLADKLAPPVSAEVSVRGTDRAQFIYAVRGVRAVEASFDHRGQIWVEYWPNAINEDPQATKEETFSTPEAAIASITEWLWKG